ncbi:SusC/RagA family TonB-linked outer membrane protein [Sphingobacterium sp. SGL-16]|jgi:TonB-linked SusC/RagA family outer membrane protein|uniref:SusC/RagA family TonB-linked outer membrane protein n=1 Tax=Sphingobacterium sp. SGL-16 TaxID=2710883 RepID=UPI0013EDCF79|nr:SusC/RagA family TonB-linked outer membrane protein [Sphingobacterium sp. SGL-16]NGM73023.1 SusC/RagA family TonB-linked outer membrane protein [Sphingobacterium sp. SGL-16]
MLNKIKWGNGDRPFQTKLVWLALISSPFVGNAFAYEKTPTDAWVLQQTIKIGGKVLDSKTNQPLSNVSIQVNGKAVTSSKVDGTFTLDVPTGAEVRFNLIGYESYTQKYSTANSNITIRLTESSQDIDEVVVTALGIKREQKALGYSVSTVSGEQLTDAISNNWSDALVGKVAGLNVTKSNGGPLGSNEIVLRGETSFSGDNSALIVIDGVVMEAGKRMTTTGQSNYLADDSPVDFGSSLADINPDDIESITVLKGPAASALYGYRGANGALIITTKQGKKGGGFGVSVNSNTTFGTINRWPDYQYEYGQGDIGQDLYYSYGQTDDGSSTFSTSSAWGPKFDGQMFYQYDPEYYRIAPPNRTLWQAYPNNRKDLFTTDVTATNSISISGSTDKTSARFAYTNVYNSWIIPNMGYNRNSIAGNLTNQLTEKLSFSTKINYNHRGSDNLPNSGYNNQSYMYFVRGITPNMDSKWFEDNWRPNRYGIEQTTPFSNLLDNPKTMSYDMINSQNKHQVIGNIQADYKFTSELSLMLRGGLDFSYDQRTQSRPFDTYKYAFGYYREQGVYNQEVNADFLFTYNNQRNEDFKFGGNFGGAMLVNVYDREDGWTRSLSVPNEYNFSNSATTVTYSPYLSKYAVNSLYGMGNASYKDVVFLDATLRTDWASTLASPKKGNVKPFFYPSVNASVVLSDVFELPQNISFWKFRASAAAVGGGGKRPYLNSYTYPRETNFPGGASNPTSIPDEELTFENKISYELGTEFRMFKNRAKIDVTVYKGFNVNQIIETPIDPSSGYRNQIINGGKVSNKGLEIELNGDIIKNSQGFGWSLFGNYTAFDTKIEELPVMDEDKPLVLSTIYGSRGTVEARLGGRFGDMYGLGYLRSPEGQIVYSSGLPVYTDDVIYIGNPNARQKFGIGTTLSYKNLRFNVLFDGQFGGVGYSLTHAVLMEEGKLRKTIPGRYNGIIGNGVIENADGTYSPNNVVVAAGDYYRTHFNRDNIESNTFSTDFVKLREARLDYSLPKDVLSKLKASKVTVGIYGRDLLVFSNWPAFDPEFGSLNASGVEKGGEIAQFPSTRNFGLNLSVSF